MKLAETAGRCEARSNHDARLPLRRRCDGSWREQYGSVERSFCGQPDPLHIRPLQTRVLQRCHSTAAAPSLLFSHRALHHLISYFSSASAWSLSSTVDSRHPAAYYPPPLHSLVRYRRPKSGGLDYMPRESHTRVKVKRQRSASERGREREDVS